MPPSVTRQSPISRAPVRNAVPVDVETGIKILEYGRGKTGKTRFASSFPKPMLIVGTEDGTKSICSGSRAKGTLKSGAPIRALLLGGKETGIDFVRILRSDDTDEIVALVPKNGYKTVVNDTAGGVQDTILKEILNLDNAPVQKSWGLTDMQTWGVVGMQFKERMRQLLDLADRHGTNVVVIAHERNFNESGSSDVMVASVGAALTPSAAAWLNAACDYICQTYIREQSVTEKKQQGSATINVTRKTGRKEYCLRVGPHEIFMTGFRLPPGVELPDSIVNPTYEKIAALIRGEKVG